MSEPLRQAQDGYVDARQVHVHHHYHNYIVPPRAVLPPRMYRSTFEKLAMLSCGAIVLGCLGYLLS